MKDYKHVIDKLNKLEWHDTDELPDKSCRLFVVTAGGTCIDVNYSHMHKAFNATDSGNAEYAMNNVIAWAYAVEVNCGK